MPRLYGSFSEDELRRQIRELEVDRERNDAAQRRHDAVHSGRELSLSESHIELVLAREGAAIGKAILDRSTELQLRENGTCERLP